MKTLKITFAIAVLSIFASCGMTGKTKDVVSDIPVPQEMIENDWEKALAKSAETGKPIYIEFYTTWCGYCKKFKANTLGDKEVQDYLAKNYVTVLMDAEKGKGIELKRKYNVSAYPTHVVLNMNQTLEKTQMGYLKSGPFISWLKGI